MANDTGRVPHPLSGENVKPTAPQERSPAGLLVSRYLLKPLVYDCRPSARTQRQISPDLNHIGLVNEPECLFTLISSLGFRKPKGG